MQKNIRTDLAREASAAMGTLDGVETISREDEGVEVYQVQVNTPAAARALGKAMGRYVTLDATDEAFSDMDRREHLAKALAQEIKKLLPGDFGTALVVGLGNARATPDALGPKALEMVMVTRHLIEYMPEAVDERLRPVAAYAPGVLGVTGLETAEVVRGVVKRIKPGVVICIDALAARSAARVGNTLQLSDTGIQPGSGLGNMRSALNAKTLGCPVLALGVPTVVYASTIAQDAFQQMLDALKEEGGGEFGAFTRAVSRDDLLALLRQAAGAGDMVVTPKNIDELVAQAASVLALGLNLALHKNLSVEEIRAFPF